MQAAPGEQAYWPAHPDASNAQFIQPNAQNGSFAAYAPASPGYPGQYDQPYTDAAPYGAHPYGAHPYGVPEEPYTVPLNDQPPDPEPAELQSPSPLVHEVSAFSGDQNYGLYSEKDGPYAPPTHFDDDPIGYIKSNPKSFGTLALAFLFAAAMVLGITLGEILPNQAAVRERFGNWNPDAATDLPTDVEPMPFWDVTDSNNKIIGVSLGGWLVLERWMREDWFVSYAPNGVDEWTFIEALGSDKAKQVLDDHWSSWVVESDLDLMQAHGVNTLRIPIGFWTLIPTEGDEPYVNSTQLIHLNNMLGWCYKRGMRALLDIHGMPGSQSGDQSSGHVGQPDWFNSTNQARGMTTVKNLISWIQDNKYKTVVSGVSPVNEPIGVRFGTPQRVQAVQNFYEQVYPLLKDAGLPMYFHHAFVSNPTQHWAPFAQGKDPRFLVLNDNPYPGYFPSVYNQTVIQNRVCNNIAPYTSFPVPTVKTEWSIASGLNDMAFNHEFFNMQAATYGWQAGWFFWSWRTENSTVAVGDNRQAGSDFNQMQYSFQWVADNGIAPATNPAGPKAYLQSMDNICGDIHDTSYTNPSAASPAVSTEGAASAQRRQSANLKLARRHNFSVS